MAELIRCFGKGGLLVVDAKTLRSWAQSSPWDGSFDALQMFSVLFDPEGQAGQANETNEDWAVAWRGAADELLGLINGHKLGVLLLNEGDVWIDLAVGAPTASSDMHVVARSTLSVRSGIVALAELSQYLPYFGNEDVTGIPEYDYFVYRETPMAPGDYELTFLVDRAVTTHGGSAARPAISVRLQSASAAAADVSLLPHAADT